MNELGSSVALLCPDHRPSEEAYARVQADVFGDWNALVRKHEKNSLRMLHLHGTWSMFLHRLAVDCRKHAIPYVISPRGMLEPWALNHKRWKKILAWNLYQKKDLCGSAFIHATAESEATNIQRLGIHRPIVVIPNGVPIPSQIVSQASLPEERRTALFLGRVHPKKGLMMLADAWAKLRPKGWRMVVVGPDENGHAREIARRVDELEIADEWEFFGQEFGAAKENRFLHSQLFILPTHSENFGISVAEALSYGLPVLTTTGAPWQGLIENRCGWWVEPNAESVVLGLRQATSSSPELLSEYGHRGREWVERTFTWPAIAAQMINAYQSICGTESIVPRGAFAETSDERD